MKNNYPKCKNNLNNKKKRSIKIRDKDKLWMMLLFGEVDLKIKNKSSCDLCGARLR